MKDEPRRYCRKCLLSELDEKDFYESLRRHIANIEDDLKVSDELYRARLDHCRECADLVSGMCRKCGCYVELRAVMKKNRCPAVRPAWEAVRTDPEEGY